MSFFYFYLLSTAIMKTKITIKPLVYNSPSLGVLCVCRIRESMACFGQNVENNLIEKLTAGNFDDLRDPNVPVSLEDMCKYLYYKIR